MGSWPSNTGVIQEQGSREQKVACVSRPPFTAMAVLGIAALVGFVDRVPREISANRDIATGARKVSVLPGISLTEAVDPGSSKKRLGFFIHFFLSLSSFFWILFNRHLKQREIDEVL